MIKKNLTKTQKRKLLFEQTCKYITSLGFDGPYDEEGYGHIDFHYPDENICLNLRRSSMDLCSYEWPDTDIDADYDSNDFKMACANYENKINCFIKDQQVALDLNI